MKNCMAIATSMGPNIFVRILNPFFPGVLLRHDESRNITQATVTAMAGMGIIPENSQVMRNLSYTT